MASPTPEQLAALLRFASQRTGIPPEQLLELVQSGQLSQLAGNLSPDAGGQLQQLLSDPAKAQALLNNPNVQAMLRRFLDRKA